MMKGKISKAFSLTEVMIGILLTALVVSSVMGVILTARRDAPHSDRKMAATYAAKQVLDQLKNYVTAACDLGQGPGAAGDWTLPNDSCTGNCPQGCLALESGAGNCKHNVTPIQPPIFSGAPLTIQYKVTDAAGGGGGPGKDYCQNPSFMPEVDMQVTWGEDTLKI